MIVLRPWDPDDAGALVAARAATDDLDTQFGPLADAGAAARFIETVLVTEAGRQHWAIVADGVAVGNVGLTAIEHRHDTAWVSYWLARSARGLGTATRAAATVADRAFRDGLFRLELGHRVNNPASCRVATAAGFRSEGIERAKLRYGAERFDVETHARLASDPTPEVELLPVDAPA
ncbi:MULTISPECIES: GNAT family N-acetyltransferase [Curtobacterium]|uniref:GNAT family N-acetyltransferase n=1 Tax=Curtobacterium flaccumfaciens TaxID=2035 RepID=UPI0031063D32